MRFDTDEGPLDEFPVRITDVLAQKSWQPKRNVLENFTKRWPGHPFALFFRGVGYPSSLRERPLDRLPHFERCKQDS